MARETKIPSDNLKDSEPSAKVTHPSVAQKSSNWWQDGNGGGSEKHDVFWEQAHFANSKGDFDHKAAREVFIPSVNQNDREPQVYNQVQTNKRSFSPWHSNGNGLGSEKLDAFWDMGHSTHTDNEFNLMAAKKTFIPSANQKDEEPTIDTRGFSV